jgi:hypothetical protein
MFSKVFIALLFFSLALRMVPPSMTFERWNMAETNKRGGAPDRVRRRFSPIPSMQLACSERGVFE